MVEVQAHGFSFEKWVRDHFFSGYTGTYMQKWDVAPDHNVSSSVPIQLHKLPVSVNPELRSKEKGRHEGRVDGIGMDA